MPESSGPHDTFRYDGAALISSAGSASDSRRQRDSVVWYFQRIAGVWASIGSAYLGLRLWQQDAAVPNSFWLEIPQISPEEQLTFLYGSSGPVPIREDAAQRCRDLVQPVGSIVNAAGEHFRGALAREPRCTRNGSAGSGPSGPVAGGPHRAQRPPLDLRQCVVGSEEARRRESRGRAPRSPEALASVVIGPERLPWSPASTRVAVGNLRAAAGSAWPIRCKRQVARTCDLASNQM
jgi:hypothetical protein